MFYCTQHDNTVKNKLDVHWLEKSPRIDEDYCYTDDSCQDLHLGVDKKDAH